MYWISHIEGGPRRVNHASVAIGDYIYSFGGYCSGEDYTTTKTMDVHMLNTNNLRWSLIYPRRSNEKEIYPNVPFQRYGHSAVAYKHCVYIWGGRNDETVCGILFCFDTHTMRWSKPEVSGPRPGARDGHTASVIGDYMYLFGGFEDSSDQFSRDLHLLNLKTLTWRYVQTFGEPPSYRDFHTSTIIPSLNRMYIFGGRGDIHSPYHSQDEVYCPKIVYLDLGSNQWHVPTTTGSEPLGRRSHSAFIYNNRIFIFGGYNGKLDTHFNDLHCFDPTTNVWRLVRTHGTPPKARRRQSCLVIGRKMFLFGGTCPHNNVQAAPLDLRPSLVDYNDTHVLDFFPTLKTLAIMSVIENNLDQTWLPQGIRWDIRMLTQPNSISRPLNHLG